MKKKVRHYLLFIQKCFDLVFGNSVDLMKAFEFVKWDITHLLWSLEIQERAIFWLQSY